jgi:hypothetical protein
MESLYEAFEAFADKQRVERLQECLIIQERVNQCLNEKKVEAEKLKSFEERKRSGGSQSSPKGFTSWMPWRRKEIAAAEDEESEVQNEVSEPIEPRIPDEGVNRSLIRLGKSAALLACDVISQDDVWACRALSLQCGHELARLKDCVKEKSEGSEQNSLTTPGCKAEKDILAQCMSKNAFALEHRLKRRKEAAREERTKETHPK